MALKSVIDIDINDADFQRFAAAFAKYQEALTGAPAQWDAVAQSASVAAAAAAGVGVGIARASENLHDMTGDSVALTRNTERQASAWSTMATSAGRFTSRVIEATRSLLRWGELTGLISGILGGGGLFGIDRLATQAGNQRRSSLGIGTTPGESNAFEVNYSRLVDTSSFLSGVNAAMTDVRKSVGLIGAGITSKDTEGKDTAQVGSLLIDQLKKIADQTPNDKLQNVLEARHLDQFINVQDFQRLKNTPAGEIDQYKRDFNNDTKNLDLTKSQSKDWQDLQTQLHRAGTEIETTFIRFLTPLAKPIGALSAAFTKLVEDILKNNTLKDWIDALTVGLKWLDTTISSGSFHESVNTFITNVGNVAHKIGEMIPSLDQLKTYETTFEGSMKAAGDAIKVFADAVDTVANALASAAHRIIDPWERGTPVTPGEAKKWNEDHPDNPIQGGQANGDDQGSATGWDRLKSWLQGGRFSGHMDHQENQIGNPWEGMLHQSSFEPRGIRNNNPLNLSYVSGQGAVGSDGRFGIYDSPESGIAASERQLLLYQDRDRLNTLSQIIGKWAPANENDTGSYISQVSRETGIAPNAQIDLHDRSVASAVIEAMIKRETGKYVDPNVVRRGVDQGLTGNKPGQNAKPATVAINIMNSTGGNAVVSASQLG